MERFDFGDGGDRAGEAIARYLDTLDRTPALLGVGEPTHGIEAFPLLRNRIIEYLVRHRGFRSVAIESDCLAGPTVDAYVTDGQGDLDGVMARGFSHEFGALPSNRALVSWLREFNADREPGDRVRFYGFDGPMEMMAAPSPSAALRGAHGYLLEHLGQTRVRHSKERIDELLGFDGVWASDAAMMDPAQSVGDTEAARALRPIADDLLALMEAEAPALREESSDAAYQDAHMLIRTALGLLRYHSAMAWTASMPERLAALGGLRDAMMAANLKAVVAAEAERGPTLVFAHNAHVWKRRTVMDMAGTAVKWWCAGALIAPELKDRYVVIASDMAEAEGTDAAVGDSGSLQGVLSQALAPGTSRAREGALFPAGALRDVRSEERPLHSRKDLRDPRYIPIDGIDGMDAVAFIQGRGSERVLWGDQEGGEGDQPSRPS
ncbi:erythromycin esterase family protein [Nocardiopsis sp. RSe5-2]|uniref:Erythromycin esterase family protein n=1 Tax=Nocardiopsis endophytica TaxID=3018445 RepID=A0ABT4U915_9ACTN|nr:erythromycin esterase family protein [Nocardiopsis endophytica]MDA2813445.1 erythromycin esterase family protein [Nocardiopsis endophytica]